MREAEHGSTLPQIGLAPKGRWAERLLLAIMLILALALRLDRIGEPMVEFHPMRQYWNATLARAYYFQGLNNLPDWQRELGETRLSNGPLEPPILVQLVALSWALVGGEWLWIPRLYSILCWLGGGVFLYLLARSAASIDGAFFATAFYLFVPFGVAGSRTFLVDPMMMLLMLASLYAIWLYHEQPSRRWLIVATVTAGLAVLVKPICGPALFGAFAALHGYRNWGWRMLIRPDFLIFTAGAGLPAAIYYGQTFLTASSMQFEAHAQFMPQLLGTGQFWSGWFSQVRKVVGPVPFVLSVLGVLLVQRRPLRALLLGYYAGYIAFTLLFTYTTSTHDYYQLQLIPLVALSLIPFALRVLGQIGELVTLPVTRTALALLLIVLAGLFAHLENWWRRYLGVYEHIDPGVIEIAQEIGERVDHSSRIIHLAPASGLWLEYHGMLAGSFWPSVADLESEEQRGVSIPAAESLLNDLAANADFFVITDFGQLNAQPGLRAALVEQYPVLASSDQYVIFDLRDGAASGQ